MIEDINCFIPCPILATKDFLQMQSTVLARFIHLLLTPTHELYSIASRNNVDDKTQVKPSEDFKNVPLQMSVYNILKKRYYCSIVLIYKGTCGFQEHPHAQLYPNPCRTHTPEQPIPTPRAVVQWVREEFRETTDQASIVLPTTTHFLHILFQTESGKAGVNTLLLSIWHMILTRYQINGLLGKCDCFQLSLDTFALGQLNLEVPHWFFHATYWRALCMRGPKMSSRLPALPLLPCPPTAPPCCERQGPPSIPSLPGKHNMVQQHQKFLHLVSFARTFLHYIHSQQLTADCLVFTRPQPFQVLNFPTCRQTLHLYNIPE